MRMENKATVNKKENRAQSLIAAFGTWRELGIIIVTIILMIAISLRSEYFLNIENFEDILLAISLTIIVACGQMMVIIIRGIDLSVSSIIGLVAMLVGLFIRDKFEFPMGVTLLMGIGLGILLGSFNGILTAFADLPPLIATLATMSIYRGLVVVFSNGEWVNTYRIADTFLELTRMKILGVRALIWYAVIVAVGVALLLKYTRLGRQIYALGSNPSAADVAGIPKKKVTFLVYLMSGTLAGFAAVLWASRYGSVTNETGVGFELQTVAACVVGGVSVLGGSGSVFGVVLGSWLLGIIGNALTISNINPFWRLTINGVLILFAVIMDTLIYRRLGKE